MGYNDVDLEFLEALLGLLEAKEQFDDDLAASLNEERKPRGPQIESSFLLDGAKKIRELHDSYTSAGFTDKQAFELTKLMLSTFKTI